MRHSVLMLSIIAALLAGCPKQEAANAPAQPAASAPAPAAAAATQVIDEHSYAEPGKGIGLMIAADSVGWLTPQANAARPKCRCSATAVMYSRSRRLNPARFIPAPNPNS